MNGENLRDILPLLRPRSAEPTVFSQTVWYLLWIGLAALPVFYGIRWLHLRRRRLQEFTAAGQAAGLTAGQTALLYTIARRRRMQSPPRLLSSAQVFDRQLGAYAASIASGDRQHPEIERIGGIRVALGFDILDLEHAMSSTRQIDRGQTVMIWAEHESDRAEGFYPWLVLERDEATLSLAPVLRGGDDPRMQLCRGDRFNARFWREGDTEYEFETTVIGQATSDNAVYVKHAEVHRQQHRDFYRIDVDFPADFFVVPVDHEELESDGIHINAAIELLDKSASEEIRVAPSEPAAQDRLTGATRVSARVVNLSAGGLAIEVTQGSPPADADTAWILDPAFEGPFSLAGITCNPVGTETSVLGKIIKMTFDQLPTPIEKEIVRGVYEHQLQAAGGRARAHMDTPPLPADGDDDLPTS